MKLNIKKDTLIKQKFWVLLALVLPFTAVPLVTLVTTVSAEINADKKTAVAKLDPFKKPASPADLKNQDNIEAIVKQAAEWKKQEEKVWQIAYKAQEPLFRWAPPVEKEFDFANGLQAWEVRIDRAKKDLGELTDNPEQNLIHGKVSERDNNGFMLTDKKNKKSKFYRTPKVKVTIDGTATTPGEWPIQNGDVVGVVFEKGKYFNDPLTLPEQHLFAETYKDQLYPILEQVQPMNHKGEGVVQLRGWAFTTKELPPKGNRFFHFFNNEKGWDESKDISDEAWIAQEDLWIQSEIYRMVRLANDYVSDFKGEGTGNRAHDMNKEYLFTSPYWELSLKWPGGNELIVNIKNLLNRRQKLDFDFLVRMTKNDRFPPEKIRIPGLPLNPRGDKDSSRTVKVTLDKGGERKGIYSVQQALTWETAAVRRIDNVCLGMLGEGTAESNRTFPDPLKPFKEDKKEAAPVEDPAAKQGPMPMGKGLVNPFDPKGGQAGGNLTPNGFVRERYLQVTPQLRRVPVAVALIVEQEHVDRVQAAFNNSRLRFMTTQVLLNRCPGSVRPQIVEEAGDPKIGQTPMAQPPMGVTPNAPSASDDLETNVELVIYGIMTLYEKFPPRVNAVNTPAATEAAPK